MININAQRGFSILEVLIAFVILVIGILGASILIIRSSQVNVNAYETEQVALMANSFIERIRINSINIDTYETGQGEGSEENDCKGANWCAGSTMAKNDIYNFDNQIKELKMHNVKWKLAEDVDGMMGVSGSKLYQLSITWDTAKKIGDTTEASKEGTGSYYSYFIINTAP